MGKKKRTLAEVDEPGAEEANETHLVNGNSLKEKKTKKKKQKKNKEEGGKKKTTEEDVVTNEKPTVTIAVAGSIIDNAQSLELATRLAGQIARAATIFRIDEVVVFDDKSYSESNAAFDASNNWDENESGAAFLVRILRYLETPQYLRKALFPRHNSLRFVGMLPPLDAPHHLRKHEWAPFREGVTTKKAANYVGTVVDVGLSKNIIVEKELELGVRVTVAMGKDQNLDHEEVVKSKENESISAVGKGWEGVWRALASSHEVVSSSNPKAEAGMYWGYRVRYASSICSVLKECPYKGGYDHSVGTSEHGLVISPSELRLPPFRHLLIVFGGLAGLEECIKGGRKLQEQEVRKLFDSYLNTCPHQGSRSIRTEEAILISLQYFQEPISRAVQTVGK